MDFQPLQHERSASSNDEGPADEGHFKEVVSCEKHWLKSFFLAFNLVIFRIMEP